MRTRSLLLLLTAVCMPLLAEEAVVTLQSTVSGSQEQPRVMYIVPWQEPGAANFDYELNNGLAQELFVPIDRDEFVRGLTYQKVLRDAAQEGSTVASENR